MFDRMFQPKMVFSPLNPGTEKVCLLFWRVATADRSKYWLWISMT